MSDFNCRQQTDLLCTAFVLGVFLSGLWRAGQFYTSTTCTINPWKLPADTNRNQTEDARAVSIQTAAHRHVCLRAACLYAAPLPICHMTVLRGRSPSVWRSVLLLPPTSPGRVNAPGSSVHITGGRHSRRTCGRNLLRRSCRLNDSPESIGAEVAGVSSAFGPRLGNPD